MIFPPPPWPGFVLSPLLSSRAVRRSDPFLAVLRSAPFLYGVHTGGGGSHHKTHRVASVAGDPEVGMFLC